MTIKTYRFACVMLWIGALVLCGAQAGAQNDDLGILTATEPDFQLDEVHYGGVDFFVVTLDESLGVYAVVDEYGGEYLHVAGATIPYDLDTLGAYSLSGATVGTKTCWWKPNPLPSIGSVPTPLFFFHEEFILVEGETMSHALGEFEDAKDKLKDAGWFQKDC
jgi:hypothetical protein